MAVGADRVLELDVGLVYPYSEEKLVDGEPERRRFHVRCLFARVVVLGLHHHRHSHTLLELPAQLFRQNALDVLC